MKRSDALPTVEPRHVNNVIINGEPYSFLCATDEQQNKGKPEALFFKGSLEAAEQALAKLGDYSGCKTAAKMSRRLRLAFWHGGFYLPPLDKKELVDISDIERHGYWYVCLGRRPFLPLRRYFLNPFSICSFPPSFTDGCGFMHPLLAMDLQRHLKLGYVPSCFQIRIAGYKGVVLVHPKGRLPPGHLSGQSWKLQLRTSMHKFDWNDYRLGIVKYSKPATTTIGWLNNVSILLLHARGVSFAVLQEVVQESIEEMFRDVQQLPPGHALAMLYEQSFDFVMRTFRLNDTQRISPMGLDVLRSVQERRKKKLCAKLNESKLSLPVTKSRYLLGVADPTGTLKPGHCYVRLTVASGGDPQILLSKVLVTRSPAYNLGDLRVLQAGASPRLDREKYLNDVIVFPTQGNRPHPDEMGGGGR
jgi:hypothetical protein